MVSIREGLRRLFHRPAPAPPRCETSDYYRDLARLRLADASDPGLVELTALQLAELRYLQPDCPAPPPSGKGLLKTAYTSALEASHLGVPAALAPAFARILEGLDPVRTSSGPCREGDNRWSVAGGSLAHQVQAAQVTGTRAHFAGTSIDVTGILRPEELAPLEAALAYLNARIENLGEVLLAVHVSTVLGDMDLPDPNWRMQGLSEGGMIGVARDVLADPAETLRVVAHEVGHLIDNATGNPSQRAPFGQGSTPADFSSAYARLNASEDYAETHAELLRNWDKYRQFPSVCMLSRGLFGQKLMAIARDVYQWEVPAEDPTCQAMTEAVLRGDSPFPGLAEYHQTLAEYVECVDEQGQLSPRFLSEGEAPRRQWIYQRLYGSKT